MNRHVLLIAGGGTLGMYTTKELARLGDQVDVICLEDNLSTESIHFYKDRVDIAYLTAFLENRHYDTIVNFLHYTNAEAYAPYHTLLTAKCDQLIVLSSYRVYADLQHPVTETAPLLGDTSTDTEFLEKETYAMGKTRCERYIRAQEAKNWTIIRPVISFSARRLDVIMHSGHTVVEAARENRTLLVPMGAKEMHAGLDWAGNSGKLIAHLQGSRRPSARPTPLPPPRISVGEKWRRFTPTCWGYSSSGFRTRHTWKTNGTGPCCMTDCLIDTWTPPRCWLPPGSGGRISPTSGTGSVMS